MPVTEQRPNPVSEFQTLTLPDAKPPKTRYENAYVVQSSVRRLIQNDRSKRGWKRAQIQGLIDGNPPYSHSKLKESGRLDVCNVNWGSAKSLCEQASMIFWDLFSEAPTNFVVRTGYGNLDQQEEWSRQITQIAHDVLNDDPRWQYVFQLSQWHMTLQGCGPLYLETQDSVIPRSIPTGDLIVDESADADTDYWERAFIRLTYKPHELYQFIENPVAAQKQGWDVKYTRWCIANAIPNRNQPGYYRDWERIQRLLKTNSSEAYDDSRGVRVIACFWREFDGTWTHAIIEEETTPGKGELAELGLQENQTADAVRYLYLNTGRYESFREICHPMYWDRGNGQHYSVNGMGMAMFHALNIANRLRCNLVDKAMAPKLLFKPTTESHPEFKLTQLGDYGELPAGWDFQQAGMVGLINDGMTMLTELERTLSNNIAQYRQGWNKAVGNPATATQIQYEASQQYRVANTQISRYYRQLDNLYRVVIKRMCSRTVTDPLAKEFRKRCEEAGVPEPALGKIVHVDACRVTGQGSAILRQQALDKLLSMSGRFPEAGQDAVWMDWIASTSGTRNAVDRYWPNRRKELVGTEQQAEAMLQVSAMYNGIAPVVTGEQDPLVFAMLFLQACQQALQSVMQGADPMKVIQFVDLAAPAAAAHGQRMAADPMRKDMVKKVDAQVKQIAGATDKLKAAVAKKAQEQAQQQPQNGQMQLPPEVMQDLAIKKAQADLKLQNMMLSHRQRLQQRAETHQADMAKRMTDVKADVAAKDLETASKIRRNNLGNTFE